MSIEEFARKRFEVPTELIDGEVRQKAMPTIAHMTLQGWLIFLLYRDYRQFLIGPELHCKLRSGHYRLPDVSVLVRRPIEPKSYAEEPIHLAIEILSPQDTVVELMERFAAYREWGVPYCWALDPEKLVAFEYTVEGTLALVREELVAEPIRLAVAEVFSVLRENAPA
jgi:Uma2 family endonuclease